MTLYTRGKKAVTAQIPEDSDEGYANFASKIKHISGDRMVGGSLHGPLHSRDGMPLRCILGHDSNRGWHRMTVLERESNPASSMFNPKGDTSQPAQPACVDLVQDVHQESRTCKKGKITTCRIITAILFVNIITWIATVPGCHVCGC